MKTKFFELQHKFLFIMNFIFGFHMYTIFLSLDPQK